MAETFSDGYDRVVPAYLEFGPKVEVLLRTLTSSANLAALAVAHRVKTRESSIRKSIDPATPLESIDDLHDFLGLRVITYFADDVDRVSDLVEAEFEIDPRRTKDKRAGLDPDRFGYLSVHYGARLNAVRRALPEWAPYADISFEIQIRSALQHAWAEIEHDLGYKSITGSVPAAFRRRFSRLAGMLELVDEQFETLRDDLGQYERTIEERAEQSTDDVNQVTIASFIRKNPTVAQADEAIAKGHGSVLREPGRSTERARAEEMISQGLETLGEVEAALKRDLDVVVPLAVTWLNDTSTDTHADQDERDADGHYIVLTRGISLFYLSRLLRLQNSTEGPLFGEYEDRFRATHDRIMKDRRKPKRSG